MRSTVCLAMDRAESGVIATTPPITCNMEERLSQASSLGSGTHLSSVSGFSLGEVIVQRAKQGCELWPQLQSEAGTGGVASASASPLLLGGTDRTQTLEEFPTMEEGTITITEELGSPYSELGPFQTLQTFELQKSDLSPTLALVTTCSVEGDMSESFHRSPLEFAPLRPAPDLSGVSHEGCPGAFRANNLLQPLVSAVSSGHVKGSPSPSCEEQTARHGSDAWILSQCPLKSPTPGSEATEDEDVSHTDSYIQDQRFMELPSLPLGRESYRVPFLDCGPLLAQEVPTHPLSEQLDLLGHSGMQASGVHSNQNSGPPRLGAITRGSMAPGVDGWRDTDQQCSNAEDGQASLQPLQNQRDPEISYQHQPGGEAAQPSCPNGSHEPSSAGGPDASGSGGTTGTRLVTSITNSHTPNNDKVDTAIKVLPNRGSKEQESQLSPVVCLLSCTNSFLTPTMAAPLCQSTPTSYPSGQGRQAVGHQPESAGPLGFLSAPSCEELKSHCASREPVPPGTWQSSPAATLSLPPLGYLEKARASNPGMPLSFDSLVLRGLRGVSPRQRAYSAIADSLNHVLARSSGGQDLGRSPKRNIAVAFGAGPGSVQTAGGTGGCSHAGIRSDSPDRTSFCKPDPSPCPPKDVGNCSVDSLGSDSANSEGLQPGHSAADLLQQEVLPEPSSSKGQEEDSLEQNSGLPEHRILSPFPEPLIAAHTHQFKTTFTEDGMNPQASSLDTSQAGERTLTTSGHSLTSLEVDNYVPMWAPSSLTTEINHFNIDDRIPVYLRNLGIDQSPTSILGSRGLLKEVEFSASEQKVLQEPGLERFSVSEGGEETKRSAQPLDPLSMLDEEDRRKIEEIKAELLQKAKTSIGLQCTWSVKAKDSSLALDPGWPACSLPTCLPLSSTRSQIHTQDWGPLDKQWNMDKLLGTFGAGSPPTPIAAITICSRRKTPSSSPSLSASLLMAPSDHEQPPAHLPEAKVSAIEPAQCSESTVDNEEGQFPQEDRLIAKPITVRQDIAEAAEGLKDGDSISAPLRSPTRTVMSHIRVTLSPNRTRSPLSPSGKPLLLSGTQPSPSAEHSIPGTASPSPPYPPLPMPMPAICPTFPSLPDHSPGAMFPGTEQPLDQVSPEMRTLTVQGSSKVDVSTQTSGLAFTPPARSMLSQAASQDVGVSSEGTPSIPAPVTGGTTDVSGHGLTIDVPLMLPYKPAGSSKLFYVPSSGARHRIGLMDSKNSGEISQTDLNNVPPPGPQSQVLPTSGSHRALGKGTEHWNGRKTIASKETRSKEERDPRSHRNLHTQRAGGLESSPRHGPEDEGTQYRASRHPKERQQMAGSRHAPLQHTKREAWFGPCPLEGQSGFSYKERAKAAVKSAWEQPVPVDRPRGSALDELWEHFQERQQRHWSLNSSTASELSLLQRLDRLAQLLRDPCSLAAGRPRSPSITSMADSVRFLHDPGSSSPRVPSTESATSGPSDSSSAASTIDTARLVRAFGPERVLPLNGLYGTIQRQRERSAPRRERPRKGETRCPGAPGTRKVSAPQALTVSSSTSDSVAGRRGSAWLPHRPSRRLLSKKVTRLVDQGVQAGSLEIVPGATRRQTRDVGVTFPSPDPDVTLQRLTRPGDRRKGVFQTEMKPGKDHRTPAVAWYIPAHELQGDWRKENTNKPSLNRPVQAWAQWGPVPQPWREPLRQRHLQEQWVSKEAQDTRLPPPAREDGVGGKFLSTLVPLTLREALTMNKPWFISHSQERVRRLALLVEERKLQSELQSERDRLFNQPPSRGFQEWRSQHPDYSILFKKKISKQEMLDRSKRLYEQLPEVLRKREEEKRKTEYRANRLKAQLYKQKITNRVLGKKVSWQ
ncbi:uncharacterized protein alms1 isoform X2 [Mobula hypostoma]|uniref:uncharacterized protein alms1 isoform X2 n=1 Tax=Mobula hypostoma TaxID=723540 RepID=UPI002FC3A1A5